jgi:exonuclease SbcD
LVIGGSEALSSDVFSDELAYVALGHLHLPQHFRDGQIHYSGSPLPLSFTEVNYPHQILRLKFDRSQLEAVDALLVPRSTQLLCVPADGHAPIEKVLSQLAELKVDCQLSPDEYPFLEVRVLEDQPDPTRRRKIDQALEGKCLRLASIKVDYPGRKTNQEPDAADENFRDLRSFQPEVVFLNAHQERYGSPANEAIVAAFREILLQESHKS